MVRGKSTWYKAWKGDDSCLPDSQRSGIKKTKEFWSPLQATIALCSGMWDANNNAVLSIFKGNQDCESCGIAILCSDGKPTHKQDCLLAIEAYEVLGIEPESSAKDYEIKRLKSEVERLSGELQKRQT